MLRSKWMISVVVAAAVVMVAGCSSSSKSGSSATTVAPSSSSTASPGTSGGGGGGGGSANKTVTVGVLADLTGVSAAGFVTFPKGIKAGIGLAKSEGYTVKVVTADTGSTPTGALTAAQRLVEQQHVFAILGVSSLFFAAAPYLASHNIPVIGAGIDGPEWITDKNMFSVVGTQDYTKVYTQSGGIFKKLGVTNLASIGYPIPSSENTAKATAVSAQLQGLKVGYLNTSLPLGSTNVGPIVLGMKNAGVDGLSPSIISNSSFAIVEGLKQQGITLKAAVLAQGYGGDLALGGPGAVAASQGIYFPLGYEPVEMHTPATQKFQSYLSTYAGVTGSPTFAEYYGYLSVDALVQGLEAGGSNPTQASFINTMLQMNNYQGQGLWGGHSISWVMADRGQVSGADNCEWVTRYEGTTFNPVAGLSPICGQTVPGKTV
jgi:ABC-type branched-subunit amino acid transport system substrate-binding protein